LHCQASDRHLGLKGARATQWLATLGIIAPTAPNSWSAAPPGAGEVDSLIVARLGASELFLQEAAGGHTLERLSQALRNNPPGVYPVLREDTALVLAGDGVHDVLAQVCNVDFQTISLDSRAIVLTLMIGVAVLVAPQVEADERYYRIWCDPSYGPYLGASLGAVVVDSGGICTGVSA
jgi:sarcosine oxidase subunit gamma